MLNKIIFAILLFVSFETSAQLPFAFWKGGCTLDPAACSYFNRLDSLSISYTAGLKTEYNDYLFKPLRDSSLTDSIACLWILLSDSSIGLSDTTRLKQNLMNNRHTLTSVNALTWTLGQGVKSNGTSSYINTNFNAAGDSLIFKKNNCGIGIYSRTNADEITIDCGVVSENELALSLGGNYDASINGGEWTHMITVPNTLGFFLESRVANASSYAYKGGVQIGSQSTQASGTLTTKNFFLTCRNNGSGSPALYTSRQYSIFIITAGLSSIGARKLNNILEAFMDHKNAGVQ